MIDYRSESSFWLMENAREVALKMSSDNADAIVAITALLSDVKGAQAFKAMKTELNSEEWAKLYHTCEEDVGRLVASVIVINALSDPSLAHANLRLKIPAQFATGPITSTHEMVGSEKWVYEKQLREEFLARYRLAKIDQPKPDRFLI
jgi:hypothetical protein